MRGPSRRQARLNGDVAPTHGIAPGGSEWEGPELLEYDGPNQVVFVGFRRRDKASCRAVFGFSSAWFAWTGTCSASDWAYLSQHLEAVIPGDEALGWAKKQLLGAKVKIEKGEKRGRVLRAGEYEVPLSRKGIPERIPESLEPFLEDEDVLNLLRTEPLTQEGDRKRAEKLAKLVLNLGKNKGRREAEKRMFTEKAGQHLEEMYDLVGPEETLRLMKAAGAAESVPVAVDQEMLAQLMQGVSLDEARAKPNWSRGRRPPRRQR